MGIMQAPIIEVASISLTRTQKNIACDLSFSLLGGEIIQLLGANGIGKTTILRALAGLIRPESGQILWSGEKVEDVTTLSNSIVYIAHLHGLEENLTPLENLNFLSQVAAPSPIRSSESVLKELHLESSMHIQTARLSAGQKQRVSLAKLLMFDAPLWLLDEPFTALDDRSKSQLEDIVDKHLDKGGAVVIATHQKFNCKHNLIIHSLPELS
jgi:heme exporter protein A